MFFVLNKEKIKTYLISVGTVILILITSIAIKNKSSNEVVQTSSAIQKMPIYKVNINEKKLALSINCTENIENLNDILDILSKMQIGATFFVTGELIDKYPNEIKEIINNKNNELGSLCNNYASLKGKSNEEIRKEIEEGSEKLNKLTGIESKLLRLPYGEYNNNILEIAESQNKQTIQWNIDSLDYNDLKADEMWEIIEENISSGSIILMHNEYIGNSLETIIQNIKEKGYTVTNVSNILYKDNYKINEKGEQYVLN